MKTLKLTKQEMKGVDKNTAPLTEFSAAVHAKCPRCRRGDIFPSPIYGFKVQKMNVNCPHCEMRFERQPGYFYASMFVSYAMNVAEMVTIAIITYMITDNLSDPWLYMATIFPVILLLSPLNYRYSRVILMYWLTPGLKYIPEMGKDKNE